MKLTYDLLHSAGTSGNGFNSAQLAFLGVKYPPKKGWLTALIGKEIPDEVWEQVFLFKGKKLKKQNRRAFQQGKIPHLAEQFNFQI